MFSWSIINLLKKSIVILNNLIYVATNFSLLYDNVIKYKRLILSMVREDVLNRKKTLNNAFYASLFLTGINLFYIFLIDGLKVTPLAYFEFVLFPVLGYLTKKSSKMAATTLLGLFIVDRIMGLVNWFSYMTPINTIVFFLISLAFWQIFYKAYLYLK